MGTCPFGAFGGDDDCVCDCGVDAIALAKRFYSAFLPALGYGLGTGPEGLGYALPVPPGETPVCPDFYVKPPFDGHPAAALAAGGTDEGPPGFRASYGARFYVGYLRDRQGNKIAIFFSDPDDPDRDG